MAGDGVLSRAEAGGWQFWHVGTAEIGARLMHGAAPGCRPAAPVATAARAGSVRPAASGHAREQASSPSLHRSGLKWGCAQTPAPLLLPFCELLVLPAPNRYLPEVWAELQAGLQAGQSCRQGFVPPAPSAPGVCAAAPPFPEGHGDLPLPPLPSYSLLWKQLRLLCQQMPAPSPSRPGSQPLLQRFTAASARLPSPPEPLPSPRRCLSVAGGLRLIKVIKPCSGPGHGPAPASIPARESRLQVAPRGAWFWPWHAPFSLQLIFLN